MKLAVIILSWSCPKGKGYGWCPKEIYEMKISEYKSYDDLPLFLNAAMEAKVLGVAPSSAYELMHEAVSPTPKIGSRIVVPKEKFVEWVRQHTKGGNSLSLIHI